MIMMDEYMDYDYVTHRYTLTSKAIDDELGINMDKIFGLDTVYVLKHVSRMVYLHIASKTPQLNTYQRAFLMSNDEYREGIKEAMIIYVKEIISNKSDNSNFNIGEYGVSGAVDSILYSTGVIFRGKYPQVTSNDLDGYGEEF